MPQRKKGESVAAQLRELADRVAMAYTKCSVLNHTVEFKLIPTSGYISVGIDGTLIGNYPTVRRAMFDAAEHVRLIENQHMRPSIPENTWKEVEQWATING